jgi:hypothetical protein
MLTQRLGIFEAIFIVHIGGALLALLPLLFLGGGHLGQWRGVGLASGEAADLQESEV